VTTLAKFTLVGLLNTIIGYGAIVVFMFAGVGDYGANVLGYLVGLFASFFLNRRFTFRSTAAPRFEETFRFLAAAAFSYGANLAVLIGGRFIVGTDSAIVQAFAVMAYTAVFYPLNRHFVFTNLYNSDNPEKCVALYKRDIANRISEGR